MKPTPENICTLHNSIIYLFQRICIKKKNYITTENLFLYNIPLMYYSNLGISIDGGERYVEWAQPASFHTGMDSGGAKAVVSEEVRGGLVIQVKV